MRKPSGQEGITARLPNGGNPLYLFFPDHRLPVLCHSVTAVVYIPRGRIVGLSDRCFSVFDWEMTGIHREPGHDGRNWPGSGELSLRLTDGVDFTNLAHRSRTQESIRRDGLLFGRHSD